MTKYLSENGIKAIYNCITTSPTIDELDYILGIKNGKLYKIIVPYLRLPDYPDDDDVITLDYTGTEVDVTVESNTTWTMK